MAPPFLVAELIKQVIQIATKLMVDEADRLYWLEEDIRWVEIEMRHILSYVKVAEARQSEDEQVGNLVTDIRNLALDTKAILEKFGPRMKAQKREGILCCLMCPICFFCDWCTAHCFSKEIEKIKRRASNIEVVRNRYRINDNMRDSTQGDRSSLDMAMIRTVLEDISGLRRNRNVTDSGDASEGDTLDLDPRQPMLHVEEPYVVGFDNELETLKAKLLNQSSCFEAVSIVGMGGLGKTTLAKKLYKSAQQHFEHSAKVTVSQNPKIKEILRDIAKQVGLETRMIEEDLEANLYAYLSERKCLLFLDDIWQTKAWDDLKRGIPNTSQRGSRVIITSRDNGVGRYIGGDESLHGLRPLDFVTSWTLFSKLVMAPSEDNVPTELKDVGSQIVERCGGLPLAIVVTAGMIRQKERLRGEWEGVLECIPDNENEWLRILALSYIDLPLHLKKCFLYLGIFPEDHEITAFELINIWVAEGFIQANMGQLVEDIGERYLNNLVSRNLIQVVDRDFEGRVTICRIHDLLHSLCILLGRDETFFNTLDDLGTTPVENVRRVTTHYSGIRECPLLLNTQIPNLSAFLCFDGNQIIQERDLRSLYSHLKFLKVLVIDFDWYISPKIPDEIGDLSPLSFFRFSGDIKRSRRGRDFDSQLPHTISKLKNLLTLDVRCKALILPSTIWELPKIRHLLLPHRQQTFAPSSQEEHQHSNVEQSLRSSEPSSTDLQTLGMIHADDFNPVYLYKFSKLRTLGIYYPENYSPSCNQIIQILSNGSKPVLQHLERLELSTGTFSLNKLIPMLNLSHCRKLRELIINARIGTLPQLPSSLSKLTLFVVCLRDDPLETLGNLPNLKILQLCDAYDLEIQRSYAGADSFPQLAVLEIVRAGGLAELAVHESAMPKLKKLVIDHCNNLKVVSRRLRDRMTNQPTFVEFGSIFSFPYF